MNTSITVERMPYPAEPSVFDTEAAQMWADEQLERAEVAWKPTLPNRVVIGEYSWRELDTVQNINDDGTAGKTLRDELEGKIEASKGQGIFLSNNPKYLSAEAVRHNEDTYKVYLGYHRPPELLQDMIVAVVARMEPLQIAEHASNR